nr:hypothetical protein Itr_chr10CG19110 [Ipomoea trifida]
MATNEELQCPLDPYMAKKFVRMKLQRISLRKGIVSIKPKIWPPVLST